MQNIEYQEEEPLYSINTKHDKKVKDYKQYLVDSGCMMHFVKFLLGLRNKQMADDSVPSDDVMEMFREYIGTVDGVESTANDGLKQQIEQQKKLNQQLKAQIEQCKKEIQQKRQQNQRKAEEKRLKAEEQAKNPKKAGKK